MRHSLSLVCVAVLVAGLCICGFLHCAAGVFDATTQIKSEPAVKDCPCCPHGCSCCRGCDGRKR